MADECCLWCKKRDFTLHYSPRMLLTCSLCLNAYCHVDCDAVRHHRPQLSRACVESDTDWFCGTGCSAVASRLAEETNAPKQPLAGQSQYSLELVRLDPALPAGREAGTAGAAEATVEAALRIFAASFAPLTLEDGRNMLELVCRSHMPADAEDAIDYSTFRVVALRCRNAIVSVATLRVFGPQLAELPFVATRESARRSGNMRRLVCAVEALLGRLGVGRLVLPAITEVEQIWVEHFGMRRMGPEERAAVEDRVITADAATSVMLTKDLTKKTPARAPAPQAQVAQWQPVQGAGTFSYLLAPPATPHAPAADAAAAAASAAAADAAGMALADVLLTALSDVDEERRAMQARVHEQELALAAVTAALAAAHAALVAAGLPVPMEEAVAPPPPPIKEAAAVAQAPPPPPVIWKRAPAPPPARKYKYVYQKNPNRSVWSIDLRVGEARITESGFATAEAAARRCDVLRRAQGLADGFNFPEEEGMEE